MITQMDSGVKEEEKQKNVDAVARIRRELPVPPNAPATLRNCVAGAFLPLAGGEWG